MEVWGPSARPRWPQWQEAATAATQRGAPAADAPPTSGDYEALLASQSPWAAQIELDVGRTFPEAEGFGIEQQLRLGRLLGAYATHRPDVGYCQGMNFVAGLLLIAASDCEEDAFGVFVCLMDTLGLAGFYSESFPLLLEYVVACDRLLALEVPKVHAHLEEQGLQPCMYLHEWLLTLFINTLPPQLVLDLWDVLLQEGLCAVIPTAVAVLQALEDDILRSGFDQNFKLLKGVKDVASSLSLGNLHDALQRGADGRSLQERARAASALLDELGDSAKPEGAAVRSGDGSSSTRWLTAFSRTVDALSPRRRRSSAAAAARKLSIGGEASPTASTPGGRWGPRACSRARRRPTREVLQLALPDAGVSPEDDAEADGAPQESPSSGWPACCRGSRRPGSPTAKRPPESPPSPQSWSIPSSPVVVVQTSPRGGPTPGAAKAAAGSLGMATRGVAPTCASPQRSLRMHGREAAFVLGGPAGCRHDGEPATARSLWAPREGPASIVGFVSVNV